MELFDDDCMPCGYGSKPDFISVPKYCMHCKYEGRHNGNTVCTRNSCFGWLFDYPVVSPVDVCEYFQYHKRFRMRQR